MVVEYTCVVCGVECKRRRSPGNMRVLPRFCSQKCNGANKTANKKGTTKNFDGVCQNCGKEFSTYKAPSRADPKFCSLTCIGESQTGENNPAYNGGKYLCNGYYVLFMPNHPNRSSKDLVLEHRYVMECKIGRYLTKDECVHHIDHNKINNKTSNLMLFENNSAHMKFHADKRRNKNG